MTKIPSFQSMFIGVKDYFFIGISQQPEEFGSHKGVKQLELGMPFDIIWANQRPKQEQQTTKERNKEMKFSIYHKDGKYHIYRNTPKTEGSELPDDKPMYVCDSMDDANEWINGKDVYADYQLYELYDSHSIEFDDDVVRLAQKRFDAYRNEGEKAGWGKLEIDRNWTSHTYRSSADWKNEPLLFTFEQTLKWSSFPSEIDDCTLRIRDNYIMLIGMYDALYEIGRTLVFDADFKIKLMGGNKVWVMKECY